ncbi:hypothetical protein B484DRAFT_469279 [Ochromonadaceae sp. CCMP2298]|nr:hypothetical protein B484DRAFT_469279 [Ochromonadaceae sp. CCMP2298]
MNAGHFRHAKAMNQQIETAKAAKVAKAAKAQKLLPWRVAICGGEHVSGTKDYFRQGEIWVCKCLKKPVNNYELLMIFMSIVSVTKLHLSDAKNKWDNAADGLIAKFPTQFGPPFCQISGGTVQNRLNQCMAEVVLKLDLDQKKQKKEVGEKKNKDDATKNNCLHFEGKGIMPGLVSMEEGNPTVDFDTSFDSNGMEGDQEESGPQDGEIDTRDVIPPGRRKRAAAEAFETAKAAEWKNMLKSIKGHPEEKAAEKAAQKAEKAAEKEEKAAKDLKAAEDRKLDREERKDAHLVLLAMLHQMKNGVYSSGTGV